jgi:hypothetical protein
MEHKKSITPELITLNRCRTDTAPDGSIILTVEYSFCNIFDTPKLFALTFEDHVIQHGKECPQVQRYSYPADKLCDNSLLTVQPNETAVITRRYFLSDRSSVTLKVKDYLTGRVIISRMQGL